MTAKQTMILVIATLFVLTICRGVTGQAPAPEPSSVSMGPVADAPTVDCLKNLLNLSDCLTFVEAGSNLTKPDKACCPELAELVESSPQCLCKLMDKNATSGYGINIDLQRALSLPTVCRVSTPPISFCSVINGSPAGSPTASDGSMSPGVAPGAIPSNGNSNGVSKVSIIVLTLATATLPSLFGIY